MEKITRTKFEVIRDKNCVASNLLYINKGSSIITEKLHKIRKYYL